MEVSKYDFDCRKALHFGLRYAKGLGHDLLECEHVALALLRQKWDILEAEVHGFTERSLETFLQSYPKRFGAIQVEFGPRLNRALDTAERNSLKSQVSIDELWYVLSINSSAIKQALEKSKIDIRKREGFETADFWKQNNDTKQETTSPKADIPTTQPANNLDKALREFTTDLTQEAASDALDPVFGRDEEIRRVLEILGRKKKNNPILLGEPGVGKTAIAEGLAVRIVQADVPQSLKNKRVEMSPLDLSHEAHLFEVSQEPEIWKHFEENGLGKDNFRQYIIRALRKKRQLEEYSFVIRDLSNGKLAGMTRVYAVNNQLKNVKIRQKY